MKKLIRFLIITCLLAGIITLMFIILTVPDVKKYSQKAPSIIYSAEMETLGVISEKNITYIKSEDIPDILKKAVVSVEDKRYYKHFGVDPIGILRALIVNTVSGQIVQGASTITQQTAKLLYFSAEQTVMRKLREAVTAVKMNFTYSKDEVLCIYLNEAYFGGGAYGIYEASKLYFSKEPNELTISECALLAGLLQAPSAYCPLNDEGLSLAYIRCERVLSLMYEQNYISSEELNDSLANLPVIDSEAESYFLYGTSQYLTEAFCNRATEQAISLIADYLTSTKFINPSKAKEEALEIIYNGEVDINTDFAFALNDKAVRLCEEIIEDHPGSEAGFILTDSTNASVVCYYAGDGYYDVLNISHQPGSTIKPLYMAYLYEQGYISRESVVNDCPITDETYAPQNSENIYMGWVNIRDSLAYSLNSACLQLFGLSQINKTVDYVKALGFSSITNEDYSPAFCLGGLYYGLIPNELIRVYSAFSTGGIARDLRFVTSVKLSDDTLIVNEIKEKVLFSEQTAEFIKSALTSAVAYGTAQSAQTDFLTYGKTGTTDNYRDVWFVGGCVDFCALMWVGDNDGNYADGLYSALCCETFSEIIDYSSELGMIDGQSLDLSAYSERIRVSIAKPNIKKPVSRKYYTDQEIINLYITPDDMPYFEDELLYEYTIDSQNGLIFNYGVCPQQNAHTVWFPKIYAPSRTCNLTHKKDIFDNFRKWVKGL